MRIVVVIVAAAAAWLATPVQPAVGAESIVRNGDFQKWTGGAPDHWEVSIGARNGADEPQSQLSAIPGPALMLRGDASTMAWRAVSQEIPARPGVEYVLEFQSRTKDIQREGRQFNNCYVGVFSFSAEGQAVSRKIVDVSGDSGDWKQRRVEFSTPAAAASTKVMIFLSKSGILAVRSVSVSAAAAEPAGAEPGLITNGDFSRWSDDRPAGWTIGVGARNGGDRPASQVQRIGDAGLALQGQASTLAWHSVSQQLALQAGKTYALTFEAQSKDVRRQGRQFDNCYVGVMSFDAAGKRAGVEIKDLSRVPQWTKQRVTYTVPDHAVKTELLIFLSKSGTLMVRSLSIQEATPQRPFRGSR